MTDEEKANNLENKILEAVGDACYSERIDLWEKKHGAKVLCQVVNELCLKALHQARQEGREEGKKLLDATCKKALSNLETDYVLGYEACKAQSVRIAEEARDRQLTPHYADAIVRELQEMKPKE